ncbi:MAG TPA: UDP-N-acetylmuramoyl-L-alanine--D-glutamate ligase, partial [Firmicutes bacterium]|nr:UDP-N-acetylmuramoyl-L-alanine--D-glutamate ligase [Bacillota bacterium]
LLKAKYPGVAVVGNIGVPYAAEVSRLTKDDYVVAEISSFQMETADTFHPHIAAVLNITPDHLDRHKTLENYIAMKERIFRRQDAQDFLILNASDPVTLAMAKKSKAKPVFFSSQAPLEEGIFLQQGHIILSKEGSQTDLIDVKECQLLGVHNYENMMAAVAMALCAGVDVEQIRQGLRQFRGVAHRIEYVRTVDGVDYYNDSKGTNVDAAIRGILAMEKPCVLLGGGYDKGAEYDSWLELFDGRVKKLILLGQTAQKIAACCDRHGFTAYEFAQTFDEALQKAKQAAQQGDCVLLSPACASWGMFDNYEQRGDLFKAWVRAL